MRNIIFSFRNLKNSAKVLSHLLSMEIIVGQGVERNTFFTTKVTQDLKKREEAMNKGEAIDVTNKLGLKEVLEDRTNRSQARKGGKSSTHQKR